MGLIVPDFGWKRLPSMLGAAIVGALVAGSYGIVHDQVTYSLSEEYFTLFKFEQFRGADFGFPERVFVAEVGFFGTWWVGLIAGWVFGRIAFVHWPRNEAWVRIGGGFLAMLVIAGLSAFCGSLWSAEADPEWLEMIAGLGVEDTAAFVKVGRIHNAGYAGGLAGMILVASVLWVVGNKRTLVDELRLRLPE